MTKIKGNPNFFEVYIIDKTQNNFQKQFPLDYLLVINNNNYSIFLLLFQLNFPAKSYIINFNCFFSWIYFDQYITKILIILDKYILYFLKEIYFLMDLYEEEPEFIRNVNLLKSPPNFQQAENHSKAQIIHKEVINDSQRCSCCNLHINSIKYPLLTDLNEFMVHGTAYKFFLFIKINFILLSIVFIIAGIYNLIQNFKGDQCIKHEICQQNLYNLLSIFNRLDSEFDDYILDTLYFISILIQLAFIRYISCYQNVNYNLDQEIDSELTISECSVQIQDVNTQWDKTTIMDYLVNYQSKNNEKFNIIDCCLIYNQEHFENQLKVKIREILIQNNDISLKNVINRIVDQIYILHNREQFLKFNGEVLITLSYEVIIILFIFKKEAINFKKAIGIDYKVVKCPRPTDVNWSPNFQVYNMKRFCIKYLIGFCVLIIVIPIQQAKSEYIIKNHGKSGNQLYFNILLSLSIGVLLMVLRKIYYYLMLSNFQDMMQKVNNKRIKPTLESIQYNIILLFQFIVSLSGIKFDEDDVEKRKTMIWCSGGFSQDIINIILINAFSIIILSIIDDVQVWKFIKIIYYKYFNKNSTLTQFEANQLMAKKMNFNQKKFDLILLIGLCSFCGYMYPIFYLITLITLFIIYWINKYQVINYGVEEEFKFEFYVCQKFHHILNHHSISQLSFCSYQLSFLTITLIGFFKSKPDIIKRMKIQQKAFNNDLYSKCNPLIDESLLLNEQYEKWEQQYVEGLQLNKSSRQAKFYSALQLKLLREFEREFQQSSIQKVQILPVG
ncbi:unnamed protein product [Paramecium primaurelia]|uniref:Transmembrane protein n=1 Tax=Paramecium primaurelia TaxID=5886 RepID=A0A8S1JWN4_PARPR|nr:unnamed protein product [Paramecium primaurelia]